MSLKVSKIRIVCYGVLISLLASCARPPYNNFDTNTRTSHAAGTDTASGASNGLLVRQASKNDKLDLIQTLSKQKIEYIQYGDTMTLIVPTDKYFMFASPRFNELCYPGLANIVKLLRHYPRSPIYIAGFTDNVGSRRHKKLLSEAQAETMLSYLWANGIKAYRLKAEGYGEKNAVADNAFIHGSALNRRLEIQWFTGLVAQDQAPVFYTK